MKEKSRDVSDNSGSSYFSNKLSPKSEFSPFIMNSNEDFQRKHLQDTLSSPVFKPIPSSYAFDYSSKIPAHLAENNINSMHYMNNLSNKCKATVGGYMVSAPLMDYHSQGGPILDQQPSLISPPLGFMNVEAAGSRSKPESSSLSSRLTIFYDNAVYAYNDVSPEQVESVMRMANTKEAFEIMPAADYIPNYQAHYSSQVGSSLQSTSAKYIARTVPQARKASLNRFLKRRKRPVSILNR
ncbi:protein TIFY 6B-like isoform X2 [Pistacia vera]|uniref:protein TIFY 6B-like isoform X2 n=1 Tax=Pistacia vera TaxID=55513 RepID=UPI001263206C|nr:protein TIFY 6B-like isoform X2 [Pistacia vera]